jgi:hypothetical protein
VLPFAVGDICHAPKPEPPFCPLAQVDPEVYAEFPALSDAINAAEATLQETDITTAVDKIAFRETRIFPPHASKLTDSIGCVMILHSPESDKTICGGRWLTLLLRLGRLQSLATLQDASGLRGTEIVLHGRIGEISRIAAEEDPAAEPIIGVRVIASCRPN